MVTAQAQVAVVEKHFHQVEALEAAGDAHRANCGRIVHPPRPQAVGPAGCGPGGQY
jgi:hypothetical protein